MAKISFDKYYTSPNTARFCIEKTYEILGKENITEIVEPSAGCGTFSNQIENCKAYDLYPQSENITKQNFLTLDLGGYKKGRLFIGNPPYGGQSGKLIKQFYDKCVNDGDYIAWILPIGYYDNYNTFNKFEIVYQCAIETNYSNVKIKSTFIIYKRYSNEEFKNDKTELKSVKFIHHRRENNKTNKLTTNYDYSFCGFGDILKESKVYENVSVYGVIIDEKYRNEVILFLKWLYYYNKETNILTQFCISVKTISGNLQRLNKLIKIAIPEIE